jgi:hypothetical protein
VSRVDYRKTRPVRYFLATCVFRILWWPCVAVFVPFAFIGAVIDWLSDTAFPFVAEITQPVGSGLHRGALNAAWLVLGTKPAEPQS